VEAAKSAQKAFDAYWDENLMSNLAAGGAKQEAAINRVAEMSKLSDIRQLKAFFGRNHRSSSRSSNSPCNGC